MPTLDLDALAPELTVQVAALPASAHAVTVYRNWDRFGGGTSQLTVRADFRCADADAARDAVAAALRGRGLSELPFDTEWHRFAFETTDGACMRVWIARDAQSSVVVRVDTLLRSDDAAGRALLADEHRDQPGTLTSVRRLWEVDRVTVVVTNDAVFE